MKIAQPVAKFIAIVVTLFVCTFQLTAFASQPSPPFTMTDTKVGTGSQAKAGQKVTVHYTGWLYEQNNKNIRGQQFDSSRDKSQPFTFTLGAHQVIQGWDQGLVGMRAGGMRTLIIPAGMAYGKQGAGGVIPPNTALVFDVELLAVE